jgi:hypothetical protein
VTATTPRGTDAHWELITEHKELEEAALEIV